jgi:predicted nucleic acid-binding protein
MTNLINIRKCTPHHLDKYFIDSNVWFWFTYAASNEISGSHAPARYQVEDYPKFIEKILDNGASLYHSPLILSEIANVIERTEYEIYLLDNPTRRITRKEFRKKTDYRKKVMEEINLAWGTIVQMSECLDIKLDAALSSNALKTLNDSLLDPYDAFYIDSMSTYDVTGILTDDSDFNGLDISLYTANKRLIQ